MRSRCWPTVATICALGVALPAQAVWVVDAQQGPGSHFKDLPQAIAAVAPGDTLLVRATGSYMGTTISRGVAILGERAGIAINSGIKIQQLPPGERVALENFRNSTLACVSCEGSIHLQNIEAAGNSAAPALSIQGCKHVSVADTKLSPGADILLGTDYSECVAITGSSVSFTRCSLAGLLLSLAGQRSTRVGTIHGSLVTFTDTTAFGGSIRCVYDYRYSCQVQTNAYDAFAVSGSRIFVSGASDIRGGGNKIVCYDMLSCSDPARYGFITDGATVVVRDPLTTVTRAGGVEVVRPLADLAASGAHPAGNLQVQLRYAGSAFYWLAVGHSAPVSYPTLDPGIWLDLRDFVIADGGMLNGSKTVSLPVPPTVPRGLAVTMQLVLALGVQGELSLPATVLID